MKRLLLVMVVGAGLVLPACGGSGADYYKSIQAASDDLDESYVALSLDSRIRLDSLSYAPPGGWDADAARSAEQLLFELGNPSHFDSEAVDLDLMLFRELRTILLEANSRMDTIEPHAEVVAIHAEIQAVCLEWADLLARLINELETAQSSVDLIERLGALDLGSRFDAVHERLDSNCVELQAAAERDQSNVRFGGAWVGGPSGEATTVNLICG